MKILLVDDDVFLRDMYATKFTELGDVVVGAQSGEQALRLLSDSSFDLVIIDMVMPGMTGVDVLQSIKKNNFEKEIKCIVLSNQGEESDMQSAYDLGAVGYIIKAESIPSEVVQKVHKLVL